MAGKSPFSKEYFDILKKRQKDLEEHEQQEAIEKKKNWANRLRADAETAAPHNQEAFEKIHRIGNSQLRAARKKKELQGRLANENRKRTPSYSRRTWDK